MRLALFLLFTLALLSVCYAWRGRSHGGRGSHGGSHGGRGSHGGSHGRRNVHDHSRNHKSKGGSSHQQVIKDSFQRGSGHDHSRRHGSHHSRDWSKSNERSKSKGTQGTQTQVAQKPVGQVVPRSLSLLDSLLRPVSIVVGGAVNAGVELFCAVAGELIPCKDVTGGKYQAPLPFKCRTLADVIFVVDSSGSIGPKNFKKQLSFIANIVASFNIGDNDVRVGLVVFSTDARIWFDLRKYNDLLSIQKAILNTPYEGDYTYTDKALRLISSANMFKGGRDKAPDVVVVITDGQSTESAKTLAEARKLISQGVRILSVGITYNINEPELVSMSSGRDYVFKADDFDELGNILSGFVEKTCTASNGVKVPAQTKPGGTIVQKPGQQVLEQEPVYGEQYPAYGGQVQYPEYGPPEKTFKPTTKSTTTTTTVKPATKLSTTTTTTPRTTTTTTTTTTTPKTTTTTTTTTTPRTTTTTTTLPPPPSVIPCYNTTKADIILLIDASTSIGPYNWQKQVKFAAELVQAFTVGPRDVLFGCVIFNSAPTKVFDLNTYLNTASVSKSLLAIPYPNNPGTNTHLGLSEIREKKLFSSSFGGRPDARDLVIVMTDGQSNNPDQTKIQAKLLRDTGVSVITVGIGLTNNEELTAMASKSEYVFVTGGYSMLDYIKRDLVKLTCDGA